jgi:hypothetical protein
MANKLINQLSAATSVADTDLVLIGNPSTGQLYKATKAQISNANVYQALTDATTISWDVANGNLASVTLGGNRTLSVTNASNYSFGQLVVTQDTTGNRTLSLPNNIPAAGLSLSTAGGARDILTFFYDGSEYFWSIEKYSSSSSGSSLVDLTFNFTSNVGNTGTTWQSLSTGSQAYSSQHVLSANTAGYFQSRSTGAEPAAYMMIGLDPDASLESYTSLKYAAYFYSTSIQVISAGTIVSVINGTGRNRQANDLLRLNRTSGGTVTAEWSSNSGSTWTVAHTFGMTDAGVLYPKLWFNDATGFIVDPKTYNFS